MLCLIIKSITDPCKIKNLNFCLIVITKKQRSKKETLPENKY